MEGRQEKNLLSFSIICLRVWAMDSSSLIFCFPVGVTQLSSAPEPATEVGRREARCRASGIMDIKSSVVLTACIPQTNCVPFQFFPKDLKFSWTVSFH